MSDIPISVRRERCLLSEFGNPCLCWTRLARSKKAITWLVMGTTLWAMAMMWLGDRLQANALGLAFEACVPSLQGPVKATSHLLYGWMAQANEGPFYLLIGPILLLMSQRFALACSGALNELHESGRLKVMHGQGMNWWQEVERRNRWSVLPLLTLPLFVFICLNTQLPSIARTAEHYPTTRPKMVFERLGMKTDWREVGYIQSVNFPVWVESFECADVNEKLDALEQLGFTKALAAALFAELDRKNALATPELHDYLDFADGKPKALRLVDAVKAGIVELKSNALWPAAGPARWLGGADFFQGVVKGRLGQPKSKERERYVWWFTLFIILTQLQIAMFFMFMTWLLWKIVFWLVLVYEMLPSKQRKQSLPAQCRKPSWLRLCCGASWKRVRRAVQSNSVWKAVKVVHRALRNFVLGAHDGRKARLVFEPVLKDPGGKYGLGALFRPYNLLVLVVALGSSFMALHFPDGEGMRALTDPDGAGTGATRAGHFFALSVAIGAVLVGPLLLYPAKLREWAERSRLFQLRRELRTADEAKACELMKEEAVITGQSTWPQGDARFRLTIFVVFAVLLLPVGTAFDFLPSQITPLTRMPQVVRASCKAMAEWLYDVGGNTGS